MADMQRTLFPVITLLITLAPLGVGRSAKPSSDSERGNVSEHSTHTTPGSTKATAVMVCKAFGELGYVSKLTCANGKSPVSRVAGHVGTRVERESGESGETKGDAEVVRHMIDKYEVRCGMKIIPVYLDMNHCPAPKIEGAPEGLIFTPRTDK